MFTANGISIYFLPSNNIYIYIYIDRGSIFQIQFNQSLVDSFSAQKDYRVEYYKKCFPIDKGGGQ